MASNNWFAIGVVALLVLAHLAVGQEVCPEPCSCECEEIMSCVDCSGRGLTQLPVFADQNIQILDLSDNHFSEIPRELAQFPLLHYLDMSANNISQLPEDALAGMNSLSILILSNNYISNWADIHPNQLLLHATNLRELRLTRNQFTSFSSNDGSLVLASTSLRYLDLSSCRITKVSGAEVIGGLTNLEQLKLSDNPIVSISSMVSRSLKKLELNNCKLAALQSTVFTGLDALKEVNLAHNYRLSLGSLEEQSNVRSGSLRKINLSHCNMNSLDLQGFPQLLTAVVSANMIQQLGRDSFTGTPLLEHLDLSFNSIHNIHKEAFLPLHHLKTLDLSFNMISRIDGKLFKSNDLLTDVNLSRNFIGRLSRISAESLAYLNVSWCEIMTIDPDALASMARLGELDLSHNLLSDIPDALSSDSLQTLDLSMCRLSTIRNGTFTGFPELARLNLAGNRFTTPFRVDFFRDNPYLREIRLGDNPWRCDCRSDDFFQFFQFLTDPPGRIGDRKSLLCNTPEDFFGSSWEASCRSVWYPYETMGNAERIWTWLMVGILSFFGIFCLISSVKKFVSARQKLAAERERAENLQELREIARENRVRLMNDAPQNAPDARESRPPCYEDAILLPKLDAASFASLDELMLRGKRRKRRRNRRASGADLKDDEDEDDVQERLQLRQRQRTRSEDVLSRRFEDTTPRSTASPVVSIYERPTSTRVVTLPQSTAAAPSSADDSAAIPSTSSGRQPESTGELHYVSIDLLSLDHGSMTGSSTTTGGGGGAPSSGPVSRTSSTRRNETEPGFTGISHSPYAKRKVKPLQHINRNGSIDEITDFTDRQTSPYAKRRNPLMSSFRRPGGGKDQTEKLPPIPTEAPPPLPSSSRPASAIQLVENYFQPPDQMMRLEDELDDYAVIPLAEGRRLVSPGEYGPAEPQPSTSGRSRPPVNLAIDDFPPNSSDSSDATSGVSIEIIPARDHQTR
ncbi:leucine-rich transmembrane protein [Anopheles darlingi]|uniref:Leucine-rich transmembrane protein n=1 Tax=Anopheles darlingi TaxID=43151 RepID=W5JKA8_ANODA|nr:leucine-rich transmembrane protein [Anopheles darlingi]